MASDFYESSRFSTSFAEAVKAGELSSAARRLGRRLLRRRRLDRGRRAKGRYKAVNMVGAGAIAAVANALDRRPFPFVFGGDGASFAVSAADASAAPRRSPRWRSSRGSEFQLDFRVAAISVSEIRAAGRDVQGRPLRRDAAMHLCDVRRRRARLVRGREAKRGALCAAARAAGRAARSLRALLPLGRRAGEKRASSCR